MRSSHYVSISSHVFVCIAGFNRVLFICTHMFHVRGGDASVTSRARCKGAVVRVQHSACTMGGCKGAVGTCVGEAGEGGVGVLTAELSCAVLSCCRAAVLPSCRAAVLQSCRAAVLTCCRAAVPPCYRAAVLPCCRAGELPCCRAAVLPSHRAAVLPCCRAAVLPCCRVAVLPCCRAAVLRTGFESPPGLCNGRVRKPFGAVQLGGL